MFSWEQSKCGSHFKSTTNINKAVGLVWMPSVLDASFLISESIPNSITAMLYVETSYNTGKWECYCFRKPWWGCHRHPFYSGLWLPSVLLLETPPPVLLIFYIGACYFHPHKIFLYRSLQETLISSLWIVCCNIFGQMHDFCRSTLIYLSASNCPKWNLGFYF